MRRGARVILGSALAIAATALLAALSRAPQRARGGEAGLLRLSWSGQPERVEVCRAVPRAELENLPRHMRQAVICEGRSAEYRLTIVRDGETLADEPVSGGGVRRDRPIYVYREFAADPGRHHLVVRFTRVDAPSSPSAGAEDTTAARPGRSRLDRLPSELTLDTLIVVRPRGVALVTFDPATHELVMRTQQ